MQELASMNTTGAPVLFLFVTLLARVLARLPPDTVPLDAAPPANADDYIIHVGPWSACRALPVAEPVASPRPVLPYSVAKEGEKDSETSRHVGHIADFYHVTKQRFERRARGRSLVFEPRLGEQHRSVDCRDKSGQTVDESACGARATRAAARRTCVVRADCALGEWSAWRADADGALRRTRTVLALPQGGGRKCGPVEEVKVSEANYEEVHWSPGPWGPCRVGEINPDTADTDWEYGTSTEASTDSDGSTVVGSGECGGGLQRRAVTCVRSSDARAVHAALCRDLLALPTIQPCEVPCPRDCELGPWGPWGPCLPLGGCPMYPVQEVTSTGYSIRRRRVASAASAGGAACGPVAATRPCSAPRCARWAPAAWSDCGAPHRCGTGTRRRDLACVDHEGNIAPRSWCGPVSLATQESCRLPCAGDCVLSAWGAWSACPARCTPPRAQPARRTRRRHTLAPADPKGWQCPSGEKLEESEPCNAHSCHVYSWLVLPWGECAPDNTTLTDDEDSEHAVTVSDYQIPDSCQQNGMQFRSVWCLQDNSDRVKDSLCAPLPKPSTKQACKMECKGQCLLGPWSDWSPCPVTCGSATQRRARRVSGGASCGARVQRRVCARAAHCRPNAPATWALGAWSGCRLPTAHTCGDGLKTRVIWCSAGTHRVEPRACASLPTPRSVAVCSIPCTEHHRPPPLDCDRICNRAVRLFDTENFNPDPVEVGCKCSTYSVEVLPTTSECILPFGMKCGRGRQLRPALCFGPEIPDSLDLNVCKHHVEIPGFKYDEEFSDMVSQECGVECAIDCVMGPWSEWGPCEAHEGSFATFHVRTRSVMTAGMANGRACGEFSERRACTRSNMSWAVDQWGPCHATLEGHCGSGKQRRRVWCEDPESDAEVEQQACTGAGPAPATELECRAPCAADCVVSAWSDWSPCEPRSSRQQRDRTRVVLRPASSEGKDCPPLVEAEPCPDAPEPYTWQYDEWDDCQPLGGSPCGEGSTSRTVRCLRNDGVVVNNKYCLEISKPLVQKKWCYVPCPVDCQLSEWSPWNKSSCTCGTGEELLSQTMVRMRRIMSKAVKPGRPCPEEDGLIQHAPCPRIACLEHKRYVLPGCRFQGLTDLSLESSDDETEQSPKFCGHGARLTETRCSRVGSDVRIEAWRCERAVPGYMTPILEDIEEKSCVIPCRCSESYVSHWSDWSGCKSGQRSRTRISLPSHHKNCVNKPNKYQLVEYENCSMQAWDELEDMSYDDSDDDNYPPENNQPEKTHLLFTVARPVNFADMVSSFSLLLVLLLILVIIISMLFYFKLMPEWFDRLENVDKL